MSLAATVCGGCGRLGYDLLPAPSDGGAETGDGGGAVAGTRAYTGDSFDEGGAPSTDGSASETGGTSPGRAGAPGSDGGASSVGGMRPGEGGTAGIGGATSSTGGVVLGTGGVLPSTGGTNSSEGGASGMAGAPPNAGGAVPAAGGALSGTGGTDSGGGGVSGMGGGTPATGGTGQGGAPGTGGVSASTGGTGPGGEGGSQGTSGAGPSTGGATGGTGGLGAGGSGATGAVGGAAGAGATGGATPLGTFGSPVPIAVLSHSANDDDPSVTEDLLELYFNSDRPGGLGNGDIWLSQRASASDPWGTPSLVAELSCPEVDSTPKVAHDGLTLWLSSNRGGCVGNMDVWVSTRASRTDPWSAPVCVPELNSAANDQGPAPSPTLLEMILASDRDGTESDPLSLEIYLATRASTSAPWGTPAVIAEVNSSRTDGDARLVAGGLELYLSSNRTGSDGPDLYLATRAATTEPFSSPELITELNSSSDETDPWISSDRRYILFTSDRTGNNEIYEATR